MKKNKKVRILILIIISVIASLSTNFFVKKHITLNRAQYEERYASTTEDISESKDKIHFLKLVSSDAILVESNGRYGLIDVSNPSEADYNIYDWRHADANGQTVATYLNKIGVESLDFIIGTHSHSDHIGGILDICKAGEYLTNDVGDAVDFINENTTYIYKTYELDQDVNVGYYNKEYYELAVKSMRDEGAKILEVQDHTSENLQKISQDAKFVDNEENINDYIEFTFENYNMKIFNLYTVTTRNENANSLVVLITKGEKKVLLMADMNVWEGTEQKIASNIGEVDLIKLGHHGTSQSTSIEFLARTNPQIAIATTDAWQPNLNTVGAFFKQTGGKIYITPDSNEAIVATIETQNIAIQTYDGNSLINAKEAQEYIVLGWLSSYIDDYYDGKIWLYMDEKTESFLKGWQKIKYKEKDYWFYLEETTYNNYSYGVMVKEWKKITNNGRDDWFYFTNTENSDYCEGAMVTGWQKIAYNGEEEWFYFTENANEKYCEGAMVTGWQKINYNNKERWYYFNENGVMQSGEQIIDGYTYTLSNVTTQDYIHGELIDGERYYLNEQGTLLEDEALPEISSIINSSDEKWVNENVIITVMSTDEGAGISYIEYSYNQNDWRCDWASSLGGDDDASDGMVSGIWNVECGETLYVRAIDNVGNISEIASTNIKIDRTVPTISSVTGNVAEWTNQEVTLTIEAEDNESGISEYSFDNGQSWQSSNSKTYTENTNEIKIQVKDNAGNITSYSQTIAIDKIDRTAPTITITPNGASESKNKNVTIIVEDKGGSELSSNNSYQYQLSTSNTVVPTGMWNDYASATEITIGDGLTGDYYLWIKTIADNAGNKSAEAEYKISNKFTFDNSEEEDIIAPELSVEYSTTELTNKPVIATIKSNEEIREVDGWTISQDAKELTKTYTTNIIENVDVYDMAGNKETIQIKISNIDKIKPELNVEYDIIQTTNKSVTVTIIANEQLQQKEGWTISQDAKELTKTYTTNIIENVDVYDMAGNKETIQIKISNIDKIKPELNVEYDIIQTTNKSVTVTIIANEQLQQKEGWTISQDGTKLTKIYTENIVKNIDVYDLAGNKTTIQVKITNIDKTQIEAIVEYSTTTLTNKNVTVKIITNKEIQEIDGWKLAEDKKILIKEYSENSDENIKLQDMVGNEREIKVSVQNIDKEAPKVNVEYSMLQQTNKNLIVTITANEELKLIDGWSFADDRKTITKIYTTNTTEDIYVYDLAGNTTTAEIKMGNIDKIIPKVEVKYSTIESTNEDVVVTIVADEKLQGVDGWNISEDGKTLTKKYERNTEETIKIYDIASNELEIRISIKNIDKTTTQNPEINNSENSNELDTAPTIIPNAGNKSLIGLIISIVIITIALWIKNMKYKDIK